MLDAGGHPGRLGTASGMSIEHLSFDEFELKAAGEGEEPGTVLGYGSVFNNVDLGKDIVLPGAFSGATARKTKMLWQHDTRQPIGVWDELTEDSKGLKLKGRLALGTRQGAEAYELLRMGALDGLSIGFTMGQKDFSFDPKENVRRIKAVKLMEVSLVTFPMNPRATTTRVKSATSKRDLEQALRDAGLTASEAKYVVGLTQLPAIATEDDDEAIQAAAVSKDAPPPSETPDEGKDAAAVLKAAEEVLAMSELLAAVRNVNFAGLGRA